jgi:hypothetical protein
MDMIYKEVPLNNPNGYHLIKLELPFSVYNTSQWPQFIINPKAYLVLGKEKIELTAMNIEGYKNTKYMLILIEPFTLKNINASFEFKTKSFMNITKKYPKVVLFYYDKKHKKREVQFPEIKYYTYNDVEYDLLSNHERDIIKK